MADLAYMQQIDDLKAAAAICNEHRIVTPINGIQPEYPRWSAAWEACEVVWRNYLDMQTMAMDGSDDADRAAVIVESRRLGRMR